MSAPRAAGRLGRIAAAIVTALLAANGARAGSEALLQAGAYEVQVRLELPNVPDRAAATRTATICVPRAGASGDAPLPVLSSNNPLARCPAENVRRDGTVLSFDIVCAGRGAATGRAVYTLEPRGFAGRIAMVMGGKNMTMTEIQTGHRVGACDPAGSPLR